MEVDDNRLTFRVSIHESADVGAAVAFWAKTIGAPEDRFLRTTLKRHNPKTVRKNVGTEYRGCLVVKVKRSTDLGRQIAGWMEGIVGCLPPAETHWAPPEAAGQAQPLVVDQGATQINSGQSGVV